MVNDQNVTVGSLILAVASSVAVADNGPSLVSEVVDSKVMTVAVTDAIGPVVILFDEVPAMVTSIPA